MKSTFFLSTLALALTATAQITDLSPKEFEAMQEWAEGLFPSAPTCVDKCLNDFMSDEDPSQNVIPPCAVSDQDSEDSEMISYNNSLACMCADRIYQAKQLECVVKACSDKELEKALHYQLATMYTTCAIYSDQRWPEPKTVMAELCVADEIPKNIALPDIPKLFEDAPLEVLVDYEYADEWPSQTATTWAPAGTPLPDTREPLECQAKSGDDTTEEDDAAETTSTETAAGPKVTQGSGTNGTVDDVEDSDGAAAGSARVGGLMMAVAGLVGGLAVLL